MPPAIIVGEEFPSEPCEQSVISKLVKVIQVAIQCSTGTQQEDEDVSLSPYNQTLLTSNDLKFARNVLSKLINATETFLESTIGEEPLFGQGSNITKAVTTKPTPVSDGGSGRSPLRLQHLEMIKVGVLIFVISIIMLTTCRMVLQLFVKFKPEKPQMN